MANDYGYFGSGNTGYAHYKQSLTATSAVPVAAVEIAIVAAVAPAAEHCCLSSR